MLRTAIIPLLLLLLAPAAASAQGAADTLAAMAPRPAIIWQVKNRFRLFEDADQGVAGKVDLVLADLAAGPIHGSYVDLVRQTRADPALGSSPFLYQHTRFDGNGPPPGPDQPSDYLRPRVQHIVATLAHAGPWDTTCTWSVDGGQGKMLACDKPFEFDLALDASFRAHGVVWVRTNAETGVDPVTIATDDRLVLGLGDSYAAGEGNPDQPANLALVKPGGWGVYFRAADWWRNTAIGLGANHVLDQTGSAQWWSNECHRSLFSPQLLAAWKLAAADPHRSVTFVSFACSGAATLDGFVTPQQNPPGEGRYLKGQTGPAKAHSQLEQAVTALCAGKVELRRLTYDPADFPVWQGIYHKTYGADATLKYPTCLDGRWRRQPDVIFMTLGGNDIGFGGLGAWALTPVDLLNANTINSFANKYLKGALVFVCPSAPFVFSDGDAQDDDGHYDRRCELGKYAGNEGARHLIDEELPGLLRLVADGLAQSGLSEHARVIHAVYPAPFNDETGKPCGTRTAEFPEDKDLRQVWSALDVLLVFNSLKPSVSLMKTQALEKVLPRLDAQIEKSAAEHHWLVATMPPDYARHGFCAGSGDRIADFGFPQIKRGFLGLYTGGWDPSFFKPTGAPSDWDAYKIRQPWLHSANDTLLTQMVGDKHGAISFESLSGMLHPTAEGETAIADQFFAALPSDLFGPVP
jgi:hypothetical protein